MRTATLLPRLRQLQGEILAVLDEGRVLLGGEPEKVRGDLATLRWKLARKLREYQIFKHSCVFDPVTNSGFLKLAEAGRRLKVDCIAAGDRYDRYVREWSTRDVAACWDEFRPATLTLGRGLRDHLAADGLQVRQLIEQAAAYELR